MKRSDWGKGHPVPCRVFFLMMLLLIFNIIDNKYMARISLYYCGIYYACYQHLKTLNNTNYLLPCTYHQLTSTYTPFQ
jgi:hypothetical protein